MAKLGEIIIQIRGVSYNPQDLHDTLNEYSIPLLRANNIQNGNIVLDDVVYVSKAKVSEKQYLRSGDILICTSSGSKELVGKAAFVENDMSVTFGAFCKVIRPIREYQKYIGHFFQSPYYRRKISELSAGANINNIRNEHIENLEIPLPKIEEQRRIAAVLDKVSDLISQRRGQLDKLDLLVKSRFMEMFGDPVENPFSYPQKKLSEYVEFLTSGSRGWSQYFSNEGEYFITIKNVKNCAITLDNMQHIKAPDNAEALRTRVQEGDLLISITADLGRTGVVTKEIAEHGAYINQHLTCIRLAKEKVLPLYAAYYLESPVGKSQFAAKNQNGVKAGLNFNAINSLEIVVPPVEKQYEFISYVDAVNRLTVPVMNGLQKLETLKNSLMQEYFG